MMTMPFGMKNATAAFSRAMAVVLSGLDGIALAYVDDVLIFTKEGNFEEHLAAVRKVLERFRLYNLKLSPKKCTFASKEMNFLGFVLNSAGFKPSLSRIEILKEMSVPTSVKEVKRVLGQAGFYRRHIENFAMVVEPMLKLTRQGNKFEWRRDQQEAFDQVKNLLAQVPNLVFPDYGKPFHIFTDASTVGQGGVLMQKSEVSGGFSAVSYCSRTLSTAERKWPAVQVELGAIIYALREFRPFIFMSDVELHTDHKPLAFLLKKSESSPQLARWMIELQNYRIKIVHVAGKENSLADALSRATEDKPFTEMQSIDELEDIIEFPVCLAISQHSRVVMDPFLNKLLVRQEDGGSYEVKLEEEQMKDPEAVAYIEFVRNGEFPAGLDEKEKETFAGGASKFKLDSGVLYFKEDGQPPKIYVPISLRGLIFESFHSSLLGGGHLNYRKTLAKCRKYFWPKMHSDILTWVKLCITCQLRHSPTPAYREEMMMVPANTLFAKVGLDLAGPFPMTQKGNKHILNIVCWFTKYVISVPVPDTKARTIAQAFLNHCYLKFGGCTELITDNATAFTSDFFREFCSMLYIDKKYACPHWSQGNASTERTFRTFHNILAKYISRNQPDFDEFLDAACFCYNTSVHASTGESPFFLMFARDPVFCVDQIIDPKVRDPVAIISI
uniref:RNA-directed DNA polymerase n=1 Tax=Globodera rostochiensis TaxID=31243 RepID=A0A914I313_GLORO